MSTVRRPPTLAFIPGLDRFEDFHDKIGVSFDTFGTQLTGGWLFNYIKALQLFGVRTILVYSVGTCLTDHRICACRHGGACFRAAIAAGPQEGEKGVRAVLPEFQKLCRDHVVSVDSARRACSIASAGAL